MNYLAHFHLAGPAEGALVGALLGDYIKGPLRGELPAEWEAGIRLHRHIDALSDNHGLRAKLATALPSAYRRYAGIVLDVCCDHWLSQHWAALADQPLPAFATQVYAVLERHAHNFPERPQRFVERLRAYDLLCGYGEWEAVPATLQRIGMRLSKDNPLRRAGADIRPAADAVAAEFPAFYIDLRTRLQVFEGKAATINAELSNSSGGN